MTKELLEALKSMCEFCHKQIQAQPSKGTLPHKICPFRHISNDHCPEYEKLKDALEDIDYIKALRENQKRNIELLIEENRTMKKSLKALEIIKEKRVNIDTLLLCDNTPIFDIKTGKILPKKQLEMYNNSVIGNTSFVKDYSRTLTQEEYDLLKEGLGYYDENGTKRD